MGQNKRNQGRKPLKKDREKLPMETAVLAWVGAAAENFYIGFRIPEMCGHLFRHETVFCAIGLEMICKAYIIGARYFECKNMFFEEAVAHIKRMMTKDYGHNLVKILSELTAYGVTPKEIWDKEYDRNSANGLPITGRDIIGALEASYNERYPTGIPFHRKDGKKYVINEYETEEGEKLRLYWDIIGSTVPSDFAYMLANHLIGRIKADFGIDAIVRKFSSRIDDTDWDRFVNCLIVKPKWKFG